MALASKMNCRYCSNWIDGPVATTLAYWNQTPDACHPECKTDGEKREAFECQLLDADCNDCKYFRRGYNVQRWLSTMIDKKPAWVLTNMGINRGICNKFNKPTEAFPHMSTGRACFEHRKPS